MTSLETYCRKEFQLADIPLSGVSGVIAAVCCKMCAEEVWGMVGWNVTVESEGIVFLCGPHWYDQYAFPFVLLDFL